MRALLAVILLARTFEIVNADVDAGAGAGVDVGAGAGAGEGAGADVVTDAGAVKVYHSLSLKFPLVSRDFTL